MKLITTLLAIGLSSTLMGSEIDSFNSRYQAIEDSLPKVNIKANELLAKGVKLANEEGKGCNEKKFYKVMRKRFRNKYTDEFSKWATSTDELDRVITPVENSIYQDWKWFQAPVPGGWARWVKDPSASLLKVNDVLIGDDKFEHFFGSGFAYFKKNYLKEKGLSAALKHGFRAETGYMGATTTGVMAFGDLTANFNGMRFWNHMLAQREDILGQNAGPYVTCENDKWVVETDNPINMATYIDAAFDEGINCSAFNGENLLSKVKARLKEMERDTGESYGCPAEPEKLKTVWKKYGKYAAYLINVEGHIVKPDIEFEDYMKLTPEKVEETTGFNKK